MADGTIFDGFLYIAVAGLRAHVPGEHFLPLEGRDGYLSTIAESGTLTNEQPITIRSEARTGAIAATFVDDWYNRIHIAPPQIDFGPVVSGSAAQTIVWNAYLSSTVLASITAEDDDGLTMTGITTPKTFKPLEYAIITITAGTDGLTVHRRLEALTDRFLALELHYAGAVRYDVAITEACAHGVPFVLSEPSSSPARVLASLAKEIDARAALAAVSEPWVSPRTAPAATDGPPPTPSLALLTDHARP